MLIALNEPRQLLVTLHAGLLRLFDVSSGAARDISSTPLADGWWVASCEPFVGVLTGKLAQAQASVRGAKLARFSWDLAPLGAVSLGEVEKRGASLTADGSRLVTTVWTSCRVAVFDVASNKLVAANGVSIPSGASFSPDGSRIIAGTADQGTGEILFLDPTRAQDGVLPMEELLPPSQSPGLDDAPYFSVFSPSGRLAAISNESWGGRGVHVFDMDAKKPLWGVVLDSSSEEPEEWSPPMVAFAAGDALLLVRTPGAIRAHDAVSGKKLGSIAVKGDGGFAVDEARRKAWIPGAEPTAHDLPAAWWPSGAAVSPRASRSAPVSAGAGPAKKPAKKVAAKQVATKKPAKNAAAKPATRKPTGKAPTKARASAASKRGGRKG